MISRAKGFQRDFVRAGDMIHRITLQNKSIAPPDADSADLGEQFTDLCKVYAALRTIGYKIPDGKVNIDELPTHEFWIRYIPDIDTDCWILHEGYRYPILRVENRNGRNEWLVLHCNEKGRAEIEASKW